MSLRKEFVLRVLSKEAPVAELCRQYGISRKTAYKWLRRFEEHGVVGLTDASRRPAKSPGRTTDAMKAEIVRLRKAHPTWGSKKLKCLLMRTHGGSSPSVKTIERVLTEQGLIRRRRWRPRGIAVPVGAPKVVVEAPNDLWTVDFKGWWQTKDGKRCDPLTVRDAHTRCVLALRGLPGCGEQHVRPVFEELFKQYGLPRAIQSDNGPPFASTLALGGLTRLSAWWIALGIHVVRSRPGCPQDNGAHERMHVDVCIELQANAALSLPAQQSLFDEWRAEFNHVRPHEALGMRTPAEFYRPSDRRPPAMIVPSYPKHMHPHRVDRMGHIEHRRWRVYVSRTLAGHVVAVEERHDHVQVWFCDLPLGRFVYRLEKKVSPPSPTAPSGVTPAQDRVTPSLVATETVTTEQTESWLW